MVVDVAWEREKWEEAWEVRDVCVEGGEEDAVTVVRNKRSRKGASKGGGPSKVRKVEGGWGQVWGESAQVPSRQVVESLNLAIQSKQSKLNFLSGME